MSSRRSVRQLIVAVLLGVLVGGGLMAVTPAGAEVGNVAATSWKKIWKKNLRPLADRRYYKKSQSDATYSTKAETAAGDAAATAAANAATDAKLGGYYKKTESDAKYAAAGSSYSKAEADARYAPAPKVQRGMYNILATANGAGELIGSEISYGVTLASAPESHIIPVGGTPPTGCSGTWSAPSASPGHLCIFQRYSNADTFTVAFGAQTFGALVYAKKNTAGGLEVSGSWALGVGSLAPGLGAGAVSPSRTSSTQSQAQ